VFLILMPSFTSLSLWLTNWDSVQWFSSGLASVNA